VHRYTGRAAFDAHMAIEPVKDMIAWMTTNTENINGEATVTMSENYTSFTRPEVLKATDPWMCYASIEYKEGKRAEALEPWKHVASETEKNEAETLSYSILKDTGHPDTVKTIEVYASQEYFKEVHVPSKAVQDNVSQYGNEIRVCVKHAFLKYQTGFLGR
jgi:quinol monooxygenase YgiN